MLRLILLRHAKASPGESGVVDFDRHLIPRGRRAAASIGEYLAAGKLIPDLVLCSSSRRTRDTLAGVLPSMRAETVIRLTDALYDSSADDYLAEIRKWGDAAPILLIIGHNPAIEEAAVALLPKTRSGGSAALRFPTAGLAVIDFDIGAWSELRTGTGKLVRFVEPRSLALGTAESGPVEA